MKKLFVLLLLLSSTRVHALDRFMIKPPAGTSLDFSHHLCKNLILFYPFNERSGKRENASPFYEKYAWNNAANTRFSARVNSGSDVSFLTPHGQWGQCLYGSGALNDMIAITDDDPLKITGQLSLSLWVKQTGSLAAGKQLMGIYRTDNDTRSYGLHVNPDETARFYLSSDGDTTNFDNLASTTLMNDGKWHHLVGTFNPGTSIKLYVGDVLEDEENAPGDVIQSSIYVSATNFRILGYYSGTEISYPGRLDLPMVWNRTLSREEVHQLYSDPFCMFQKPMSLELLEAATSLGDGSSDIVAFDAGASTCFTVIRETDGDVWYPSSQVFETWGTG